MTFDDYAYSQAIDEFILKMEKLNEPDYSETARAMEKVCKLLRVAKVVAEFFNTVSFAERKNGELVGLYSASMADGSRMIRIKETTDSGITADYRFYQIQGDADWTNQELDKINVFGRLLFVFNVHERLVRTVDYLTFYDKGLNIHNSAYFVKKINSSIAEKRIGLYCACSFNLRSFSEINNMLGRSRATEVMRRYVKQLSSMLSEDEVVCRLSRDNFAVLFYKENLEMVKEYLCSAPVVYDDELNQSVDIRTSAGFYMIPDNCCSDDDIMDSINAAKNTAQNNPLVSNVFYNDEVMERLKENRKMEQMFSQGIKNEEFQVYYQPKVSLKEYKITGAEALCRWIRNGELIPPMKFIPLFEQNGTISILDFYMLEHVCRDIRRWLDEGRNVVKVSVNLSRCNLGDANLLERILAVVDKYNVPHEYIEIELTETTTDVDFKELKKIVFGLQSSGISTAVDDFGVGYSSLNLICELPWNVLKIDKKFLKVSADHNDQSYLMLKHIISLAQSFGIECVVEGVETVEHIKVLKENNCYVAQGFYFDKPLPKQDFEKRLEKNTK